MREWISAETTHEKQQREVAEPANNKNAHYLPMPSRNQNHHNIPNIHENVRQKKNDESQKSHTNYFII